MSEAGDANLSAEVSVTAAAPEAAVPPSRFVPVLSEGAPRMHTINPVRALRKRYEGQLEWSLGLLWLWRKAGPLRRHVVIVNFHAVDPVGFAQQMEWLVAEFRPVGIDEASEYCRTGRPRGDWRVCLTFDDGDVSFRHVAYPVLVRLGVPATVYIIADLMGTVPFWERVNAAFAASPVRSFRWGRQDWDHTPGRAAARTRKRILHGLKLLTDPIEREQRVATLEAELLPGCDPDGAIAGRWSRLMSWAEVGELDPRLITVGAHTRSHLSLGRAGPAVLAREITECRWVLEERLARPVSHFCYPYGRRIDVSPGARRAVAEAGYRSAVTSMTGICRPLGDPYRIARIGLTSREPRATFSARVTGWSAFVRGDA